MITSVSHALSLVDSYSNQNTPQKKKVLRRDSRYQSVESLDNIAHSLLSEEIGT